MSWDGSSGVETSSGWVSAWASLEKSEEPEAPTARTRKVWVV